MDRGAEQVHLQATPGARSLARSLARSMALPSQRVMSSTCVVLLVSCGAVLHDVIHGAVCTVHCTVSLMVRCAALCSNLLCSAGVCNMRAQCVCVMCARRVRTGAHHAVARLHGGPGERPEVGAPARHRRGECARDAYLPVMRTPCCDVLCMLCTTPVSTGSTVLYCVHCVC